MLNRYDIVVFDADDTLWRSEDFFRDTAAFYHEVVSPHTPDDVDASAVLHQIETANVATTGYGVMAYTLSMIEAAVAATNGQIPASALNQLVECGYEQLRHPVELLPGVAETLDEVALTHRVMMITKGDLLHQMRKVEYSGLDGAFERIAVVAEKDTATYARTFSEWSVDVGRTVMVGNSVRSDVDPIIELGGHGIHIPYHLTWSHEVVEDHPGGHTELGSIAELPAWLSQHG